MKPLGSSTPTNPTIPTIHAWCSWHGDFSSTCRLVGIIEQGSGSGGGQFACKPCRTHHNLVPITDLP